MAFQSSGSRVIPEPEDDETLGDRLKIVYLLGDMDEVSHTAAPMVVELLDDEVWYVQNMAISYFHGDGYDNSPLNILNNRQREVVFDYLLSGVEQSKHSSIRNNSALVLRFYPERKDELVPSLLGALSDKDNWTRRSAIGTLLVIAPEQSTNTEVAAVLIDILNDPDDQVSNRAPALLGKMTVEQEKIVDELIKHLKNESSLVATPVARALGNFAEYSEKILPPLWAAHNDPEHHARTWGTGPALKKLDPAGAADAGIR